MSAQKVCQSGCNKRDAESSCRPGGWRPLQEASGKKKRLTGKMKEKDKNLYVCGTAPSLGGSSLRFCHSGQGRRSARTRETTNVASCVEDETSVPITVFLCDDHAVFRDAMKFLLDTQPDLRVVGDATSGESAMARMREISPDIVLMDVVMPEVDGIEVTREIKKQYPSTKVLMLSMYSSPEYVYSSLNAGADGYMLKEVSGEDIVAAIRAVHKGKRYFSPVIIETVIDDYIKIQKGELEPHSFAVLCEEEGDLIKLFTEKSDKTIAVKLGLTPDVVAAYRRRLSKRLDRWKLEILRFQKDDR
jgi:two-component system response regulator NreC